MSSIIFGNTYFKTNEQEKTKLRDHGWEYFFHNFTLEDRNLFGRQTYSKHINSEHMLREYKEPSESGMSMREFSERSPNQYIYLFDNASRIIAFKKLLGGPGRSSVENWD